jgi:hypothetical protein
MIAVPSLPEHPGESQQSKDTEDAAHCQNPVIRLTGFYYRITGPNGDWLAH